MNNECTLAGWTKNLQDLGTWQDWIYATGSREHLLAAT